MSKVRNKVFSGNHDGKMYRMVACSSRDKAMKLLGVTEAQFRKSFRVTSHPVECEVALADPGVVYAKRITPTPGNNDQWLAIGEGLSI